jgi:L-fucose isomerase-like protein
MLNGIRPLRDDVAQALREVGREQAAEEAERVAERLAERGQHGTAIDVLAGLRP